MLQDAAVADLAPTPTVPEPAGRASRPGEAADRLAAWLLSGPLTAALLALAAVQLLTWLPHYLTWPYWADHDVFASAARAWTRGALPYRDTLGNNFPGSIYLFLALGWTVGWDRPSAFYAFDAGLLLTFGLLLLGWSRRRFGPALPGAVGWVTFLSVYLGLDYAHAAQRDWQGPALAVMGLLLVQARPGRAARIGSGLLAAAAVSIRPQVVLLLPAVWVAVRDAGPGTVRRRTVGLDWLAALTFGLLLAFAPLAVCGALGDFARGIGLAAYGGGYNRVTAGSFLKGWFLQAAAWRWWVVPAAVVLLGAPFARRSPRTALPWLVALAGVSLYKPLSPVAHSYLDLPLQLVASVAAAALTGVILDVARDVPRVRLAAVSLVLGLGPTTIRPEFCVAGPTVRAWKSWANGTETGETPPGYRHGTVPTSAYYPWRDYRALIHHLRTTTPPGTAVANLLKGGPAAVVAMADRPSALPAESVAWLRMVRPADEARFAEALRARRNALVVWAPREVGPDPAFRLDRITPVVLRHFRPDARFGVIEVWRRKDKDEE